MPGISPLILILISALEQGNGNPGHNYSYMLLLFSICILRKIEIVEKELTI